jgi:hypothetical protein
MIELVGGVLWLVALCALGILVMVATAWLISWYKRIEGRGGATPKRPPDADLAGGEA